MDVDPLVLRDLLPMLGGEDVSITPLSGGITNHNFRLDVGAECYVLRIGGERTDVLGIDRAVEYACSCAAMRAGVGADVLQFLPEHNALLTRFVPGRVLTPTDLHDPALLERVVHSLQHFHAVPSVPGSFSPFAVVRSYHALALRHDVTFSPDMDRALALLHSIEAELCTNEPLCPCHNDLLSSNLLDDGQTVRIIDWEYAGMGDRFFDLGNLAVNNELDEAGEHLLLQIYFGEVRPNHLRRLRLMRLASDMRESLWGYLQSGISTLDFDFRGYGQTHLERFLEGATSACVP